MTEMISYVLLVCSTLTVWGAIAPPPWADVKRNPCAALPRGWQLLYWPADKTCYKIFQTGYPCPETMELTPTSVDDEVIAECLCPPGTAQLNETDKCHTLFQQGPCNKGQYFMPVPDSQYGNESETRRQTKRIGICKIPRVCPSKTQIWWPIDGRCYPRLSRGPCSNGLLLTIDSNTGLAACRCDIKSPELRKYFWPPSRTCHEHYTRGPCQHHGHLFLPGGRCDCHQNLPHYHKDSGQCYKLGGIGPCPPGHLFKLDPNDSPVRGIMKAKCLCKDNYIYWLEDKACYRLYTRGPCPKGQFLINSTTCVDVPCERGRLYFPDQKTCYRIGLQGPCADGEVVSFDFDVRPSVDGISYLGLCTCAKEPHEKCHSSEKLENPCDHGKIEIKNTCYMLYTQGPCKNGEWLVPRRENKMSLWQDGDVKQDGGYCECKPGFTKIKNSNSTIVGCESPTVTLATYLNSNFLKSLNTYGLK